MNQEFPQQRKGMSTGCLVALIVVGVLVIIVVVLGYLCYANRGKLVQYGAVAMTEEIKKSVAEKPQPGVDSVRVNSVADAFLSHVRGFEEPPVEALALYVQDIQHVRSDEVVDSLEVEQFVNAVYKAFPELGTGAPPVESEIPGDSETPTDTATDTGAIID